MDIKFKLVYSKRCCSAIVDESGYYAFGYNPETTSFKGATITVPEEVKKVKKPNFKKRKKFNSSYAQ